MSSFETDYLVIGNSAAGVTAAEHIRAADPQGSILVISREPYAAYGRPLISYLIEGKTTESAMGFKDAGFYEDHAIDTLFGPDYEAVALDGDGHTATLANGDAVCYGKCLLATGSIPFTPPIKGLAGRDNVFCFLTLDDAKNAWAAVCSATDRAHAAERVSRVAVIGGGLIGLKAAEAFGHHADDVVVLELGPRILPAVLDDEGAAVLCRLLEKHGITCLTGTSAEELQGEGREVSSAMLTNGERISCDVVITAVGVRPNTKIAVEAGAEQGRGLLCGADLQTSLPDVYAAGDVVQVTDLLDGSQRPLALWPNAVRQGKAAGEFMAGAPDAKPFEGSFAVNAVDFFDVSLLTAGVINPPQDAGFDVRAMTGESTYAKFVTRDDRLVGYILLNRPANAGIYTALIEQRVPLSTLEGDLFGQEPLNLDFPVDARWARLHKCYPSDRDERGWRERA